jgi:hypothetical protein
VAPVPGHPIPQLVTIQHRNENKVGVDENHRRLHQEEILVIAELPQHKVTVMDQLATDWESVSHP